MNAELIFADKRHAGPCLDDRARRLVGGLARLGLEEGHVLTVMLRNSPSFVDAIQASQVAGIYYCPINWHFLADEAGHILRDSGAQALLIHADLLPVVIDVIPSAVTVLLVTPEGQAAVPLDPERHNHYHYDAWLAEQLPYTGQPRRPRGSMTYTSGTTGRPKGVRRLVLPTEQPQAHQALVRRAVAQALGIRPGVRALISAPLYHSAPVRLPCRPCSRRNALCLCPVSMPKRRWP